MNQKFEDFKKLIKNKNITVLGIGISNFPLIYFLKNLGANVSARDGKSKEDLGSKAIDLEKAGISLITGENYLDDLSGDYIFKTPGMRFDIPQLLKAKENGSIITSEMELFFDLCPCKIIGITGSDGKTTTTTLIYKILCESGYTCHLGGNIGKPLLPDIESIDEHDIVIVELSSFQLHTMKKSPSVSIITNLSPNHLDKHKNCKEYYDAKKNIFLHQNANDRIILNFENEITRSCAEETKSEVLFFGKNEKCFVYEKDGIIYKHGNKILDISDIKIPGHHNVENYMAAICAVDSLANDNAIVKTAKTFGGVEHRIEYVRTVNGVRYYNSSIDSSPNRTINTLSVFDNVVLISGGKDKGIPYTTVGPSIREKVKELILIGATATKISDAVISAGGTMPIHYCTTYEEAVSTAKRVAKPGDVVLLSPASTSFDMFNSFEERGRLFKELVNKL